MYFDIYYMMNLCYYIIDLVFLLFINDSQNDFLIMVIHHMSSIFLIFFSFWANLSNIGCIVLHIHNIGNVIVYFIRVTMYSEITTLAKACMAVVLISVWIYTRVFVFGKLIILMWSDFTDWNLNVWYLWTLLVVLLVMHVYWVIEILKKFKLLLFENKVEDVSKVKIE